MMRCQHCYRTGTRGFTQKTVAGRPYLVCTNTNACKLRQQIPLHDIYERYGRP